MSACEAEKHGREELLTLPQSGQLIFMHIIVALCVCVELCGVRARDDK